MTGPRNPNGSIYIPDWVELYPTDKPGKNYREGIPREDHEEEEKETE